MYRAGLHLTEFGSKDAINNYQINACLFIMWFWKKSVDNKNIVGNEYESKEILDNKNDNNEFLLTGARLSSNYNGNDGYMTSAEWLLDDNYASEATSIRFGW